MSPFSAQDINYFPPAPVNSALSNLPQSQMTGGIMDTFNTPGIGVAGFNQGIGNFGGGFGQNTNSSPLGLNLGTLQGIVGGIGAIGNIWQSMQANRLARQQFSYMKDITETNLANQIKSYNTQIADRGRARGFTEGQTQEQIDDYVNSNSLSRNREGR